MELQHPKATVKTPASGFTGDVYMKAISTGQGTGLVGTRNGDVVRVRAGDTVLCPPGEEHWHGATADTFMSHFALLETNPDGSDPTTWLEPVPDELYNAAQQH